MLVVKVLVTVVIMMMVMVMVLVMVVIILLLVLIPVERCTAFVLDPKVGERENAVASLEN